LTYLIHKAKNNFLFGAPWDAGQWSHAETLEIRSFHPASSEHRPHSQARLLHDERTLFVFFRVEDRFVRCVYTSYQDPVWRDSCVEFFVQPANQDGYFNFEINCGGTLLLGYLGGAAPCSGTTKKSGPIDRKTAATIKINHSLPRTIEAEIQGPVTWFVQCAIPFSVFEKSTGNIHRITGTTWKANFYKCGDDTSHPHWASWAPIGEKLNFHQPALFAPIHFADSREN
jgi:hypothetical protein